MAPEVVTGTPAVPARRSALDASVEDVAAIVRVGQALHVALERAVLHVRLEGGSWTDVGRALGVSRQAARKRWRYVDDQAVVEIRLELLPDLTQRAYAWSPQLQAELDAGGTGRALSQAVERLALLAA